LVIARKLFNTLPTRRPCNASFRISSCYDLSHGTICAQSTRSHLL